MSERVRISCATDFEPRHYRFERTSGLHHGYFGTTRRDRAERATRRAALVFAVLLLIAIGFWATSATVPDELIRADAQPAKVRR